MELKAELRTVMGTAVAKVWRTKGFVVGEVYGNGAANLHVAVPAKEFAKAFKEAGETSVVTLHAGAEKIPVMMSDVVRDVLTRVVMHADFLRVNMNEKTVVAVPLEFVGQSAAVKAGGVLVKAVSEIEVEALPAHIPHVLSVDISALAEIGQSVTVSRIALGAKEREHVTLMMSPDAVVATVIAPRSDEEQAGDARTIEDVKVETEEAKAARDKEKAAKESDK